MNHNNNHSQEGACNDYDSNGWDGTCLNCGMPLAYHDIYRRPMGFAVPQSHAVKHCFDIDCILSRPRCLN